MKLTNCGRKIKLFFEVSRKEAKKAKAQRDDLCAFIIFLYILA
jgi:hypothetical protein